MYIYLLYSMKRFISSWKDKVLNQNYYNLDLKLHENLKELPNFISWVENIQTNNINDLDEFVETHLTVGDVIAHLRTKQGKRIYHSVLNEIRNMALGGDAGESGDLRGY